MESHQAEMSALYLASNPTVERFLELKKKLKCSDGQWIQGFLDRGGFEVFLPTAYVVQREGNVLTRVCPSFCLSTPRSDLGRGVP